MQCGNDVAKKEKMYSAFGLVLNKIIKISLIRKFVNKRYTIYSKAMYKLQLVAYIYSYLDSLINGDIALKQLDIFI